MFKISLPFGVRTTGGLNPHGGVSNMFCLLGNLEVNTKQKEWEGFKIK